MTGMQHVKRQTPSPLASDSVNAHLVRGAVGLIAAVLAVGLWGSVGPLSLALLAVTALAWRGCPTCWTVGLLGTLADARVRRRDCEASVAVATPNATVVPEGRADPGAGAASHA